MLLVGTAFADPIHDAAIGGDLAGVQAELDKGVDVNAKDDTGMTPLHYVAVGGHNEIIELLISSGADVNAKDKYGETSLDVAVQFLKSKPEIVDPLRKHGGKTAEELK